MPLPLTISCSSKSRLVLTFLVLPFWYLLTRVVPDIFQKSSKTDVCVCVCVVYQKFPYNKSSIQYSVLCLKDTITLQVCKFKNTLKNKLTVVTGSWSDSVSGCCLSSLIWKTSPRLPVSCMVAREASSSFGGFELNLPPSPRTRFMACR